MPSPAALPTDITPRSGFTLIDILLAVSIFAIILTLSLPFFGAFHNDETLRSLRDSCLDALRLAQQNAMLGRGDTPWGVHAQVGTCILFAGASFAEGIAVPDQPVFGVIGVGGTTEFVFQKGTGVPLSAGTLTLTEGEKTEAITVNAAGRIDAL